MKSPRVILFLVIGLLLVQSCTVSTRQAYLASSDRPEAAIRFFEQLEQRVKKEKVQNVVYAPVRGFPYLRADRFLAGMKDNLKTEARRREWIAWLMKRAREARRTEIKALSSSAVQALLSNADVDATHNRQSLIEQADLFAERLYQYDASRPQFIQAVKASVRVPDDYSTAMRVFGLYPLAYLPVVYFSDKAFDDIRERFQQAPSDYAAQGELIAYRAVSQSGTQSISIESLFSSDRRNALGMITLSDAELKALVEHFAPVILQDTVESYDRIGEMIWKEGEPQLQFSTPTIYYYLTYGLKRNDPVIQLNYAFWYTKRDGERAPWFERGAFDGMTIRVSLDEQGEPFMVDVMNTCGCYHLFLPDPEKIASAVELDFEIDPLVPAWVPFSSASVPWQYAINSGWHQLEYVKQAPAPQDATPYQLQPYENLEALSAMNGMTRNAFDAEGILKASYRIEPYIFFSMGIPKVGYMRQRGHHPIKMVGREHFDNPDLFNLNFIYKK